MQNKKQYALLLLLVAALSGCGGKQKKKKNTHTSKAEISKEVDIPVARDVENVHQFFDGDVGEFALAEDGDMQKVVLADDISWVDETPAKEGFKTVFFPFDGYAIEESQEATLAHNVTHAKNLIAQKGEDVTIEIDGHSCHSAGSRAYNLALSEKRAKVLADRFVASGIPSHSIKIVGRGMEIPAIINGKVVEGDRAEQWPNRRDEIRIIS